MALAELRNEFYLISRVSFFSITHYGELSMDLVIELNDEQSINLRAKMVNSNHVKFLDNAMNYLISHLENDAPTINITEMVTNAEKYGLECIIRSKQVFQPNKEGIFVKIPPESPRYISDYIFVSADKFEVTFAVVPQMFVTELHLYVEGNPTYLPAVIMYQRVNPTDGADFNRFGSRHQAGIHAQVFQQWLLEDSNQGYIDFDKVARGFIAKREIQNMDYFEITTKME